LGAVTDNQALRVGVSLASFSVRQALKA